VSLKHDGTDGTVFNPLQADGTRRGRAEHAGVISAWRARRHAGTNYR